MNSRPIRITTRKPTEAEILEYQLRNHIIPTIPGVTTPSWLGHRYFRRLPLATETNHEQQKGLEPE